MRTQQSLTVIPTGVGATATRSGGTCCPLHNRPCHPEAAESSAPPRTPNEEPMQSASRRQRFHGSPMPDPPYEHTHKLPCHSGLKLKARKDFSRRTDSTAKMGNRCFQRHPVNPPQNILNSYSSHLITHVFHRSQSHPDSKMTTAPISKKRKQLFPIWEPQKPPRRPRSGPSFAILYSQVLSFQYFASNWGYLLSLLPQKQRC